MLRGMSDVLGDTTRQQILALGRLGASITSQIAPQSTGSGATNSVHLSRPSNHAYNHLA